MSICVGECTTECDNHKKQYVAAQSGFYTGNYLFAPITEYTMDAYNHYKVLKKCGLWQYLKEICRRILIANNWRDTVEQPELPDLWYFQDPRYSFNYNPKKGDLVYTFTDKDSYLDMIKKMSTNWNSLSKI
jgi:hypothetical protein